MVKLRCKLRTVLFLMTLIMGLSSVPFGVVWAEIIWQIGMFNGADTASELTESASPPGFVETFDYDVNNDPDNEIDSPNFPAVLSESGNFDQFQTYSGAKVINIHFVLNQPYRDVFLLYSKTGSETDDIYLDNELLISVAGPGEGIHRTFIINLRKLSSGSHVLSMRYASDGGADGFHYVNALMLMGAIDDKCWTIYENGNLHIPCIKVMGPFGDELQYEADMQYEPLSDPMSFQVTGAKPK